jgi:hypothetical protein
MVVSIASSVCSYSRGLRVPFVEHRSLPDTATGSRAQRVRTLSTSKLSFKIRFDSELPSFIKSASEWSAVGEILFDSFPTTARKAIIIDNWHSTMAKLWIEILQLLKRS